VFIKSGAKADFTVNHPFACSPAVFEFTNQSLLGQDYYWFANDSLVFEGADLPDTLISTDSSIIHYRLVATSSSSCQGDTAEMTIFTPANPIASFDDPGTGCGPLNLNFNNTSEFHIRSNWNLGNGTVSQLENPVASYQAAAQGDSIYSISLIVDNWYGCKDTANSQLRVYPKPLSDFSMDVTEGCGPLEVNFTNLSSSMNNDPFGSLTHFWNFGDSSSSDVDPSFAFS